MHLGELNITPASQGEFLLAEPVAEEIKSMVGKEEIGVAEIDPNLSDTRAFCDYYKIGMDQSANCVILEAKRADKSWFAACVILGSTRADVNGVVRKFLDARKVSFAPMEEAVKETSMEYGAITPIGLPKEWPILIDQRVVDAGLVVIGSGIRKSKIVLPGKILATLPNAQVIMGLANPVVKEPVV
jgi:prolyl-tRNA editing enzyme YbaK/EbsC (Cys-tRNA(Pro) deacylase)